MKIFKFLLNFFSSKENRIDNLEAKNIMIIENNFNKDNLTLGSIFKVNQNIKLKNFKNKTTYITIKKSFFYIIII